MVDARTGPSLHLHAMTPDRQNGIAPYTIAPRDLTRINMKLDQDVRYRTRAFQCSAGQLRAPVVKAGSNSAEKVRAALGKR
jgi:hypothetical protein